MEVFVIPVGRQGYALYCEPSTDGDDTGEPASSSGLLERLRYRFGVMLRAAEERQHAIADASAARRSWTWRLQDRLLRWVAGRVAEQRLLWNLRKLTSAVGAHPEDLTFDQVMVEIRRILRRDYERHRLWLFAHTIGLILSAPFMPVPGPNLVAYYFAFRIWGHWLSMRGASQGLHRVTWSGRSCPSLAELREIGALGPEARHVRVGEIAEVLRLQHFSRFFERVTLRPA